VKLSIAALLTAGGFCPPYGDWTDNAFRLGRLAGKLRRPLPPEAAEGDWTDAAFRFGRALRRSYKSWSSK